MKSYNRKSSKFLKNSKKKEKVFRFRINKLDEYFDFNNCFYCSICKDSCPIYLITGKESASPGGRFKIFHTFSKENYNISNDIIKLMYFCTLCKKCEQICPNSLNINNTIEQIRKVIVDKINQPYGDLIKLAINLLRNKNPYDEEAKKRGEWIPKNVKIAEKANYAYFVGCTSSYRETESAINTLKILSSILDGEIVVLKEGEYCCGSPLIRTGQLDFDLKEKNGKKIRFQVKDFINHNIKELEIRGVKNVIFNCAGCYNTALIDWPKFYGQELPFKCIHMTQFLAQAIEENKIKLTPLNKKVTYHDPCHLGRYLKIYEEPRKIIQSIPQIQFIEMERNRENALCCGAGGGVKAGFPDEALEIGSLRVKETIKTGAEMLITSCVFCKKNLSDVVIQLNSDLKVLNIEDLIVDLLYF